jgi:hypothetical protein
MPCKQKVFCNPGSVKGKILEKFSRSLVVWVGGFVLFGGLDKVLGDPKIEIPGLAIRRLTTVPSHEFPIRIVKDPRNNILYYLRLNGDIYQLHIAPGTNTSTSTLLYTAKDHGQAAAAGLTIGPDGAFYLVGNKSEGNFTTATIMKGAANAAGGLRVWSVLARSEPYPASKTPYDHTFNGIVISPDGKTLYVNSGSRTDHGEAQSAEGAFPGVREVGLTACILRLPTNAENLLLQNDRESLRANGYLFAEGVRNSYDLRFAPNGELFGTENGPERDMPEELNWLREGHHYGFPWRIGGEDNPQQFANYDPSQDKLLNPKFFAVEKGYYQNDPTFPKPPRAFTEPIVNFGPDADIYRASDGQIKDASANGQTLSTFSAHRSPLGLVFDEEMVLHPDYRGDAFMLSWTVGDPVGEAYQGPFHDAGADLVHMRLTKVGENYQVRTRRMVSGFSYPIDAEIIGNKIYVIEYGLYGIWEITVPTAPKVLAANAWNREQGFSLRIENVSSKALRLEASTNLLDWIRLTNFPFGASSDFLDLAATNRPYRFYRANPE